MRSRLAALVATLAIAGCTAAQPPVVPPEPFDSVQAPGLHWDPGTAANYSNTWYAWDDSGTNPDAYPAQLARDRRNRNGHQSRREVRN